jgi:hypothetical protein
MNICKGYDKSPFFVSDSIVQIYYHFVIRAAWR